MHLDDLIPLTRPREPNNLRNRWRRMVLTQIGYRWNTRSFRDWARYGAANPTAYEDVPKHSSRYFPIQVLFTARKLTKGCYVHNKKEFTHDHR